jgi:hypothetical protein
LVSELVLTQTRPLDFASAISAAVGGAVAAVFGAFGVVLGAGAGAAVWATAANGKERAAVKAADVSRFRRSFMD